MNSIYLQFLLGLFLSYFLTLLILPYLQKNLVDIPNQRSSHYLPTPRGGGLAFVIVGTILNFIFSTGIVRWIPVFCLPLSVVGVIDDYKGLSALIRYFAQFLTSLILILVSDHQSSIWQFIFYSILVTAIINFFNFMDGLDGLLAACSIPIFLSSSSWSLSGSVLGFSLLNWSPAKIFMGDVGSTYLGAVFAGFAFQQQSERDLFTFLLLAFPLLLDSSTCLLRRIISKQNIFTAHNQHLFQRLNQARWSHAQVSALYSFAVIILVVARKLDNITLMLVFLIGELLVGIFLDQFIAVKFKTT
jgi:Fuc2NAc and GlcNAc transferase